MRWRELTILLWIVPLLWIPPVAVAVDTPQKEPDSGVPMSLAEAAREALELEVRQSALRMLEADIASKLEELLSEHKRLEDALSKQEGDPAADLSTLIEFYQAMKPKNAAVLLEKLPSGLAADVLAAMSSRSAGKILNVMTPERAVRISKLMARGKP